jgi:porphobilinogen synthase
MMFPQVRMRRLRRSQQMRKLMKETRLSPEDFVYPIFVEEGIRSPKPINAMPNQFQIPLNNVVAEANLVVSLGIPAVLLFGIPRSKDEEGSSAFQSNGIVQQAVKELKKEFGNELVVITDVCLCEYTSHGHCGIVGEKGEVLNDQTLEVLGKIAVSHAEAGADIVAPSSMMDGQVQVIRRSLDQSGFPDVAILTYSAKHASCMYGPFREAAGSAPAFGDRRGYQMDYADRRQALQEAKLDVEEGADIIMVKPALSCLDLISDVKRDLLLPIAAYQVSGEYAMIKAAAEKGWLNEKAAVLETLTSIKRAGADIIITYYAKDAARWLTEK